MTRILMLEDDPVLGKGLKINLETEGYSVHWSEGVRSADQALATRPFDLVLLDVGLPDGTGFELLRRLRRDGKQVPVIVLTARSDEDSVVEGLQIGANDYLRKPFSDRELLARIKVALRGKMPGEAKVRFGDLELFPDRHRVLFRDHDVELSPREFEILKFLLHNSEIVVTREALLNHLNPGSDVFDRTVDSHVSHLRSRLRKAGVSEIQISSVYGIGYRLERR